MILTAIPDIVDRPQGPSWDAPEVVRLRVAVSLLIHGSNEDHAAPLVGVQVLGEVLYAVEVAEEEGGVGGQVGHHPRLGVLKRYKVGSGVLRLPPAGIDF